jgi:hypothetical protein
MPWTGAERRRNLAPYNGIERRTAASGPAIDLGPEEAREHLKLRRHEAPEYWDAPEYIE